MESLALRVGYRIGDFCHALGVSEGYLGEVFLRDLGLSLEDWLNWERMVVARRMLVWGVAPQEVARALGFINTNGFQREFRQVYGVSPAQYLAGPPAECA